MKKRILALTMVGVFALGGVTSAAATSYYSQILNSNAENVKNTIDTKYQETDKLVYNDTITFAWTESKRVEKETLDYLEQRLKKYHDDRVQAHKEEIQKEADKKIAELKTYVDEKVGR